MYTYLIIPHSTHFMCIDFHEVDKPKQNGSADGDDVLQGSKQGEDTVYFFYLFIFLLTMIEL